MENVYKIRKDKTSTIPSNKQLTAWTWTEALGTEVAPWLIPPLFCTVDAPEVLKVEPMSPHLIFEKVTLSSGVLAMIPAGSPAVALQGPASPLSSPLTKTVSQYQVRSMCSQGMTQRHTVHEITIRVPQTEYEHHPPRQRVSHRLHAPESNKVRGWFGGIGLGVGGTKILIHYARLLYALAGEVRDHGVLDQLAVLEVDPADLAQDAVRRVVAGHKLRDDGEAPRRVDRQAGSVELAASEAVGIVATSCGNN